MKLPGIQGKKLVIVLHIAAWAILFIVPVYLFSIDAVPDISFIIRVFLRTLIFALIFYINYFFLIPQVLFKQKNIVYYVSVIILITGLYYTNIKINSIIDDYLWSKAPKTEMDKNPNEHKNFPRRAWGYDIYNFIVTSVLITGVSIGIRKASRYSDNEKIRKELEKEMLNSKLAFLKNQISPHFFFNTLNNIYSLTDINTKDAQRAILQLSKLMRYMLYESEQGDTLLSKEFDFMQNYIELMKLRLTNKVDLQIDFPKKFIDFNIPPLLFIPFIENAFKHGISNREPSFIHVSVTITEEGIYFSCNNSMGALNENIMNENSGIGLDNVKKRLELLFPGKYTLDINNQEGSYSVALYIKMS